MNRRHITASISTIVWLLLTVMATGAQAFDEFGVRADVPVVLHADYENGALDSGVNGIRAARATAPDSIVLDCGRARGGRCSISSTVAPTSDYVTSDAYRAESDSSHLQATLYSPGDVFVYRFSLMIAESWQIDRRDRIDIVWQFKRFGTHPDMFVAVKGDSLVWRITNRQQVVVDSPIPRGTWLDFRFYVRWSANEEGLSELLVRRASDGDVKKFKVTGPNMWDARRRGGYLKWGIYKPGTLGDTSFSKRTVNHDEIYVYRVK
jgi:hypothetical protein